jgi:GAF domain-containing protein/HAMP domain-containing protein
MTFQSTVTSTPARRFDGRLARTIMLLLLPITLLPVLLLGGGTYYRSYTFLRSQIITQLTTVVEGQASLITARMQAKDKFLSTLITDQNFSIPLTTALRLNHNSPAYSGVRDQLLFDFNSLRSTESEPSFSQFFIVNRDEVVIVASNPNWEGLDLSGSPLEEMLTKSTSKAVYDAAPIYSSQYTVLTSRPYKDAAGVTKATVFGIADETATRRDLLGSVVINPVTRAYLYTKDGFLLGLNPGKTSLALLTQPSASQKANILGVIAGPVRGKTHEYLSIDQKPVFSYVRYVPELQSALIVEIPRDVVFAPLNEIVPFLIALILAAILILGVIIWLGASSIVRSLVQLSHITSRFADGEWEQRAEIKRDDEIGQLAFSFNRMADELSTLYHSLETKVSERTRQVRAASEVAQVASSAPNLRDLLRRTVSLIMERFEYYDASIFMVDETGVYAVLLETGQSASALKRGRDYRVAIGANSIIGWVTGHNQPHVVSDTSPDQLNLKTELFTETHSEAALPISVGDYVLGALDVQSVKPNAFSPEDVSILQTIANQIAISVQNIRLFETTKINLAETSLLYQTSRQITQAETQEQIIAILSRALTKTSFVSGIFALEAESLKTLSFSDPQLEGVITTPDYLPVHLQEVLAMLPSNQPYILAEVRKSTTLPASLHELFGQYQCETMAVLPVKVNGIPTAFIVLGSPERNSLTSASIQPYANLAELVTTALEKVNAQKNMQQRLNDLQILNRISETISTKTEFYPIFKDIHSAINQALGEVNFLVAIYDEQKKTVQIPYMFEDQRMVSIDPFPLDDSLTSIVIRKRQLILLNDVSEEKMKELGARTIGATPKSWLGIPLMVGGEVFGALVVQDLERKERFSETDVRLLETLAGQVAGSIRNALLLNQTRQYAERQRMLHEVASRIRNSASIQTILETTAVELGKALRARKATVQVGMSAVRLKSSPESEQEQ